MVFFFENYTYIERFYLDNISSGRQPSTKNN